MPAPTYNDIVTYANGLRGVSDAARDAFLAAAMDVDFTDWARAADQIREIAERVCDIYGLAAQTLAGQWYDYCERLATGSEPTAYTGDTEQRSVIPSVNEQVDKLFDRVYTEQQLVQSLQSVVTEHIKQRAADEIGARAMEGKAKGQKVGYCRVPVGDTCAYCVMLASRGFDYLTEKSAASASHDGCDCVVVPFHKADSIPGYEDQLKGYRDQYDEARRLAKDPPPGLQARFDEAKAKHDADYRAGRTSTRWSDANKLTIAMRYNGDEDGFRAVTSEREREAEQAAEKATQPQPKPQTERERLEAQAREVYVRNGGGQGLTEEQANERFDLLVDGNTDAQLRNYINKHK